MRDVKMNKSELLTIVRENKEKHIADYNESVEDYKKAAIKLAEDNLKLAQTGDIDAIAKMRTVPQKPTSYEDAYIRAIRMLELSVEEVIEIEEQVFNQLVLDEWHWRNAFVASASLYKTI